ncbi:MAG TPA: nucleoside deaminase [Bacteroidales bacterium]|nr:nucleoside deaminase [Bacteroidales bacterium]HNS46335.1 nucleoside deaminase [Bacteroidales bacterium]
MPHPDEYYMKEALREAYKALVRDEVPVGAVIVWGDRIIARAHNLTERLNDGTAHAEMQAYTAASDYIGSKYLQECTLYVTIEPCAMCAAASFWTRIGRIVYGAKDDKRGYSLISKNLLHPATMVKSGVLEQECGSLLKNFFLNKRQ